MALFKRKRKTEVVPAGQPEKQSQWAVVKDALKITREQNPLSIVWCALAFILVILLGFIGGGFLKHPLYFGILSIPLGILVAFFMFTRFANSAAFSSIEGQMGAGASVLMGIRKGVSTTPAVNVSRSQDMVHRSLSRGGIILVGEGGNGVRQLMFDEKKKMERFIPGVPLTEVIVGDEKGQISLRKLQKHVKKLPKKLSPAQLREVRARLKAVGGLNMPIPQGPMPKNVKMPRR